MCKSTSVAEKRTRTVSASEVYNEVAGVFDTVATCPFCKIVARIQHGVTTHECEHFVSERHGCGGTIFVFEG